MRKFLTVLAAICLGATAVAGAAGEEIALEEKALELAGSSLCFPAVTGMEDESLQEAVNSRIREDLGVDGYLQRMNALISDDAHTITAGWSGEIRGDVFSSLLEAEGAVKSLRGGHEWKWSNVDLRDGHEIAFGELFTDEAAAREAIEIYLEETVAPELSPHLGNSALTPLPEGFRIEQTGLTLLYQAEQLSTLRDRAGTVKIGWNELRDVVNWNEDGIPARIGAAEMAALTADSAEGIRAMTESGKFPDIPVKIGDSVLEWTERAHLLNDPEEYTGGRMFALEGAAFRDVYLLSDAVSDDWDRSLVQGIRADRGCFWGLCIGETRAEEWHALLGEPDHSAVLDEEDAEGARTVPGTCDYYLFGEYRLQLQADTDGFLASITLMAQ